MHNLDIVRRGDTNENSGLCAGDIGRTITGIFDCMKNVLEKKPLLRIHQLGLSRRYLEKGGIKTVHIVDKSAIGDIGSVFLLLRVTVYGFPFPAIGWNT